jgi:AcrR family transcriptional regulator
MQRRSELAAHTRARILAAALELFAEHGTGGTTMKEVARVADVSPATVTNHFGTPELLLAAVVERLMTDIRVPDADIFADSTSLDERVRILTAAMFSFFERTQRWFDLLGAELTEVPVLTRAQADYWQAIQALYSVALAGTHDKVLAKTTAGLVHPATLRTMKAVGLSVREAIDVIADAITHQAQKRNH